MDQNTTDRRALLDRAVRLRWHIQRMEAEFTDLVAEIDRRHAFEDDGAVNVIGWLKSRCRMEAAHAGAFVRLAGGGADHPELRQAHRDGQISSSEMRHVLSSIGTLRKDLRRRNVIGPELHSRVDALRHELQETAQNGGGVSELRRHLDARRHELSSESMAIDEAVAFDQREVHFYTNFDGMVDLRGTLDPHSAAVLRTAVDALTGPRSKTDERTAGQQRADALVHCARAVLDSGSAPVQRGQRPHLSITVSKQALTSPKAASGTAPAELHRHGPVSAESARMIACDAETTEVAVDERGGVLDVGRASRVVPTALRRALVHRDGGCVHPNCDRPPEWCDAHHIIHWAHGGGTTLANLALLCRKHHSDVHLGGAEISVVDGKAHVRRAMGQDNGDDRAEPP